MSKYDFNYILKIILISCFGIFLFIFFLLFRNTVHPRRPIYVTPKEYGMEFEEVEFKTSDGLKLKGWLILNNNFRPTIIICHGFGTNRSDVLVLADFLFKAGYNILLFDFRAHGESQGWYTSFGYLEKKDLEAAVEFLSNNKKIRNKNFGAIGVSMGASIIIMTAAENQKIKASVADSPYVDLDRSIIRHTKLLLKRAPNLLGKIAVFCYRLRFFVDSSKVSPLKMISRISPRAVMIIGCTNDIRMPPEDAEELYLNANQPKELFLTICSGHAGSFWQDTQEYKKRVTDFFYKYLPLVFQNIN